MAIALHRIRFQISKTRKESSFNSGVQLVSESLSSNYKFWHRWFLNCSQCGFVFSVNYLFNSNWPQAIQWIIERSQRDGCPQGNKTRNVKCDCFNCIYSFRGVDVALFDNDLWWVEKSWKLLGWRSVSVLHAANDCAMNESRWRAVIESWRGRTVVGVRVVCVKGREKLARF